MENQCNIDRCATPILLSVVIITFNQEKYIIKALDSVFSQKTSFDYEVIVGNDGSVDGTSNLLWDYKKKNTVDNLTIMDRKNNIGASKNIYDLFQYAKGKYIATLEGDDFWIDDNKLQMQVDFLENNTKYIACTHNCLIINSKGIKEKKNIEWISKKQIYNLEDTEAFYLSGQIGTLVFRNIFLDKNKKYELIWKAHPIISDRTIQFILATEGTIFRLDEYLSCYRISDNTSSDNATMKIFAKDINSPLENIQITYLLKDYLKKTDMTKRVNFLSTEIRFFMSALIRLIKYPSIKSWIVFIKIFKILKFKGLFFLFYSPIEIIKHVYIRLKENIHG